MKIFCRLALITMLFTVPSAQSQSVAENATATQTIAPPTGRTFAVNLRDGVPQADQFAGADMCIKVRAAEVYAINNHLPYVDATHFSGTQVCNNVANPGLDDMFGGLNATTAAPVNLDVKFGSVHVVTHTGQTVTNSAITIEGAGPMHTIFEYAGPPGPSAVLYAHAQSSSVTNGLDYVTIRGIFFLGGNNNVGDALLLQDVNRSLVDNVAAWSGQTNGIHCEGCVTTTFLRPNVSSRAYANIQTLLTNTYVTPVNGIRLSLSAASGNECTSSTVTDANVDYLTGVGWYIEGASSMVFTGGSSEHNSQGIVVSAGSNWNTFISPDIEGNSLGANGVDVNDQGEGNYYISGLFASGCGKCNSMTAGGPKGGQVIIGDQGAYTGFNGSFGVMGNNPTFTASQGKTSAWSFNAVSVASPIFTSNGGAPSYYAGTGITSVTCADPSGSAPPCTASRGTIKVVNSSASTTSAFAEIIFPGSGLTSVPSCQLTQSKGPNYLGLFVSGVSKTALHLANANTLAGTTTFYVSWSCQL